MTNSSWTKAHVDILLGRARHPTSRKAAPEVSIVYPPCDTGSLGELEIGPEEKRERVVLSLAQFRCVPPLIAVIGFGSSEAFY